MAKIIGWLGWFVLCTLLVAGCDSRASQTVEAQSKTGPQLDPDERFGDFTRAERWYLHFSLPQVNEGIHKRNEVLLPLVEAGDLPALKVFARGYMGGRGPLGGPQDFEKAFELYERAAQLGDPESMRSLGSMYARGTGYTKDYQKAIDWLERAYDLTRDPDAAMGLAAVYDHGYGPGNVPQDKSRAEEWRQIAESGLARQVQAQRSQDLRTERRRSLTNGIQEGEAILERFYRSEYAALLKDAEAGELEALVKTGFIMVGRDYYWNHTGLKRELADPDRGIQRLEQAYDLISSKSRKRRLAEQIMKLYGNRGPQEIRNPDLEAKWRRLSQNRQP